MCLTIPGRVEAIDERDPTDRLATVRFGELTRRAHLIYLPEVNVGEYVIVQAGFAIRRIAEREALQALAYLHEGADAAAGARVLPAEADLAMDGGT